MSKLALLGGTPIRTKAWPAWPVHGEEEERAVLEVLRSGNWWYGDKVREFEKAYAAYQDAEAGISCCNGTVAIEIALLAAGIGAGDEVITTPYTFMATASAILRVNAIPVFADVVEATANLDPDDVERRITPRTRAIVPVHVAGLPVDIDRFEEIGKRHDVAIVYDAAHAWGSQWCGKGVGAYGTFNTYSFQHSKNITAGEGGILLSCNADLAETARSYTNCGRIAEGGWYEHFLLGSNLRLTEIQAAILLVQLSRLDEHNRRRTANAAYLDRLLSEIEGLRIMPSDERVTRRAYHFHSLRYDKEGWKGLCRDRLQDALKAEGIPVHRLWPLLYTMPLFAEGDVQGRKGLHQDLPDYRNLHLPDAERVAEETSLWFKHIYLLADEDDMQDVVDAFVKVRENLDDLLALPESD